MPRPRAPRRHQSRGGIALLAAVLAGCAPAPAPAPLHLDPRGSTLPPVHRPTPRLSWLEERHRPYLAPPSGTPRLFAWVRVSAAASATVRDHSMRGTVWVEKLAPTCPGRALVLGGGWQMKAAAERAGDPAVLVDQGLWCVPVSAADPPASLPGLKAHLTPATFEVLNGEEAQGADPDAVTAQAASLYIPADRGGYVIGVYAASGLLEDAAGRPFPIAVLGFSAQWAGHALAEERYLLSADTPDHHQFNLALRLRLGPAAAAPEPEEDAIQGDVAASEEDVAAAAAR